MLGCCCFNTPLKVQTSTYCLPTAFKDDSFKHFNASQLESI